MSYQRMAILILVSVAGMASYDFIVKPWLARRLDQSAQPQRQPQPEPDSGSWW